jgi:hypothetical protein
VLKTLRPRGVDTLSSGEVQRSEVGVALSTAELVILPSRLEIEPVLVEVSHGSLEAVQLPPAMSQSAEPRVLEPGFGGLAPVLLFPEKEAVVDSSDLPRIVPKDMVVPANPGDIFLQVTLVDGLEWPDAGEADAEDEQGERLHAEDAGLGSQRLVLRDVLEHPCHGQDIGHSEDEEQHDACQHRDFQLLFEQHFVAFRLSVGEFEIQAIEWQRLL